MFKYLPCECKIRFPSKVSSGSEVDQMVLCAGCRNSEWPAHVTHPVQATDTNHQLHFEPQRRIN